MTSQMQQKIENFFNCYSTINLPALLVISNDLVYLVIMRCSSIVIAVEFSNILCHKSAF